MDAEDGALFPAEAEPEVKARPVMQPGNAFLPEDGVPEKAADNHGGCGVSLHPDVHARAMSGDFPKSMNIHLSFEEALKLQHALASCLQRMGRYNRSKKQGKQVMANLTIYMQQQTMNVNETLEWAAKR